MAKEDEVYVDVAGSTKQINESLKTTGSIAKSVAKNISNLDEKMAKLKETFLGISTNAKQVKFDINTKQAEENIKKVSNNLKELKQNAQKATNANIQVNTPKKFTYNNSGKERTAFDFGLGEKANRVATDLGKNLGLSQDKIQSISMGISGLVSKLYVASKAIKGIVKLAQWFGNEIKKTASDITKVVSGFVRISTMFSPFKKIKDSITGINSNLKISLKRILQFAAALFGIRTTYTIIRNSALEWLSSTDMAAKQLTANLNYMKYSMGTAVAPLMKYLTNLAYELLRAVQKVIYFFTRINIFANASKSAFNDATGAAKKLNKQLADFDELHTLDFDTGGGGAGDLMPNIDLSSLDSFWKVFDGDWYKLGQDIGNKIVEVLEKINWNKIQSTVDKIGLHLAELLNGIISTDLFYTLGYTLAQGLNTALHFLDSFLTEFDFKQLGQKLAEGLWGITNTIDWKLLSDTFIRGINGVFTSMYYFFIGYDWFGLGEKVAQLIYDTIIGIDWAMMGKAFGKQVNAFIDFGLGLLQPEKIAVIGTKIGEWLLNSITTIKWENLATALANGINGLSQSIANFVSTPRFMGNNKRKIKFSSKNFFR